MSYRIINGKAYSIGQIGQVSNKDVVEKQSKTKESQSFKQILSDTIEQKNGFNISKHAALRLNEINFTNEDMKNIEKGFQIAESKNSKNTIMIYKNVALIASVENKTLITAVEKERAKENVFTNVDSVVIL